jgi:hypothetical protein
MQPALQPLQRKMTTKTTAKRVKYVSVMPVVMKLRSVIEVQRHEQPHHAQRVDPRQVTKMMRVVNAATAVSVVEWMVLTMTVIRILYLFFVPPSDPPSDPPYSQ